VLNILNGINNINTAWEGVSVSCVSEVWCKLLQEFMHDFIGFEPVENTVEDISRLVQEARLDKVTDEDGAELLNSHGQQLSKDLEELDTELSQQKERESEKEDEKPLPKCMKMSDVQHILSAMDTLTDELCDNDHDWE